MSFSVLRGLSLTGIALFLTISCATGPKVETTVYERPGGVVVVETLKLEATVTAVDAASRKLTLKPRHGDERTFTAGAEVVNFDQIQVGDRVRAVVVDELAITLIAGGAPPSVGAAADITLAPRGAKPGVVLATASEVTGTIIAIDGHEHTITLEFVDGSTREIKVGKHQDLSQVALGDSIRLQMTEAIALAVSKP